MIDTVDRVAPNFKASVLGRRVLSPLDLEREFGLIGGDIFHGALSLDQLFSARPVLGNGQLPDAGARPVPVRRRRASGRRRDRRARAQRRARNPARRAPAASTAESTRWDTLKRETPRANPRARQRHCAIKPKSADKPGSVTARRDARYGRHSSRRRVAAALEPPTRGLGEQRRRPPIWCCSGWRLPRFTRSGTV